MGQKNFSKNHIRVFFSVKVGIIKSGVDAMESIWQKEIEKPNFKSLEGNIKTNVLIIGGGMTGILCGHFLKKAGVDCVIAEAKSICDGVTKNTTAKISLHHGAIFHKMIKKYGVEKSRLYVKAHAEAVEKFRQMAENIPCDFEDKVSYVYSRSDKEKIKKEVSALKKLGVQANFVSDLSLPFPVAGAVAVEGQAQFNPLKFAYALAKNLKIYENTGVTELTPEYAVTKRGEIHADKIIVATHFPFLNKHGLYFLKMYQHRSYVLALQNAAEADGIYIDESGTGLSFRSYNDILLLGGGGHRTGKKGGGWRELYDFSMKYYPDAKVISRFATQDCKTLDDIAYIGQYSQNTPNLFVATGFNKWGMTSAMVSANILSDLVRGKENEYVEVFSPSRSILHKQLLINAGQTIFGLITPVTPRCAHLGCALKYNKQEHSWDCACHGSRFTKDGRVIDNPATKDIKIK